MPLRLTLVTVGPPGQVSGGHLFNQRMADLASAADAKVRIYRLPSLLSGAWPVGDGADLMLVDSLAAARAGATTPGAPWLGLVHQPPGGWVVAWSVRRMRAGLDRRAYRRMLGCITPSRSVAAELLGMGLAASRLGVVAPGVEFVPGAGSRHSRIGRELAVVAAAAWLPRKGILPLLRAFAQLPAGSAVLHLAGDQNVNPAYRRRVWRLLERPQLRDRVVVHGVVPPERMGHLYATCDLFALPSVREPYGMAYAEAMAHGLPLVGWRSGNLPWLCRHGGEGLLVPRGDVAGLAFALERLCRDRPLLNRLAEAARRRAAAMPSWPETATRFFAEVRRLGRLGPPGT